MLQRKKILINTRKGGITLAMKSVSLCIDYMCNIQVQIIYIYIINMNSPVCIHADIVFRFRLSLGSQHTVVYRQEMLKNTMHARNGNQTREISTHTHSVNKYMLRLFIINNHHAQIWRVFFSHHAPDMPWGSTSIEVTSMTCKQHKIHIKLSFYKY